MNIDLKLKQINFDEFKSEYINFILCSGKDKILLHKMLSIAIVFINCKNTNIKNFGYRIILIYTMKTNDYKPLYDFAINTGLNPISHFISNRIYGGKYENLFIELNNIYVNYFIKNNTCYSIQQFKLNNFYNNNKDESIYTIAPTSYGKTDLIIDTFKRNIDKNICVITPTKALLSQTKKRLLSSNFAAGKKVVIYPEMYNGEEKIWAIMTQERLLRLMRNNQKLSFDIVIVDEAHNLLYGESRNRLLASDLIILNRRNRNTIFKYFTPFLNDDDSFSIKFFDKKFKSFKVSEYVKSEMIYYVDRNAISLYDQFLDVFIDVGAKNLAQDEIEFLNYNHSEKNIVYLNKTRDVEEVVTRMPSYLSYNVNNKLDIACKNISDYIHPNYKLIKAIQKGILYHHGSMPDPIRIYVETLYSNIDDVKFIVTSSTLLEGINLPADRLFILDNRRGKHYLSSSDLKNLIGRVCRFNRVFSEKSNDLSRLLPKIYIYDGKYMRKNNNLKKYISNCMYVEKRQRDKVDNVLLKDAKITNKNTKELTDSKQFIENFEPGTIGGKDIKIARTGVGKSCFLNNIIEIDIIQNEINIEKLCKYYKEKGIKIDDSNQLFEIMSKIFFSKSFNDNLARFTKPETRRFYSMFLSWEIENNTYKEMISSFLKYWKQLIENNKDTCVYVGEKWGELTREGRKKLWVDIKTKSQDDLINLAIVRIKEEQDFLDNVLKKYVEVLNDIELIDNKFYLEIKYGTSDEKIIICIKNGLSLYLSKLIVKEYDSYLSFNSEDNTISIDKSIIDAMNNNNENQIVIAGMQYYL